MIIFVLLLPVPPLFLTGRNHKYQNVGGEDGGEGDEGVINKWRKKA